MSSYYNEHDAEGGKIVDWRITVLRGAGFVEPELSLLALRKDVDVHRAVEMVRAGAAPSQVVAILA